MVDGVGDLVGSGVCAVTDGAGVARGGCAAVSDGRLRLCGLLALSGPSPGIQGACRGGGQQQEDQDDRQPAGEVEGAEEGHRINAFALAVWTLRSSSPFVPPLIARVRPIRSSASAFAFSFRSAQ